MTSDGLTLEAPATSDVDEILAFMIRQEQDLGSEIGGTATGELPAARQA